MVTFCRLDRRRKGHFLLALCEKKEKQSQEDEKTAAATQKLTFFHMNLLDFVSFWTFINFFQSSLRQRSPASRCVTSQTSV